MAWRDGVLSLLGAVGVNSVCRQLLKKQPRILMFHKIFPAHLPDNYSRYIDSAMFEELVSYVQSRYTPYTLKDLMAYRKENGAFPDNAVVLTFDDGYKSFKDIALPILESRKVPATIFVCPELIDNSELIWPDELESAFENGTTRIASREHLKEFIEELKTLDVNSRKKRVLEILRNSDEYSDVDKNSMLMDWQELKELSENSLVEIGSHSLTHAILANESVESARYEIAASKASIEEKLDCEVLSFCYPNGQKGDYRASEIQSLKEAGILVCCNFRVWAALVRYL